jgi:hypothetical protein
MYTYFLPVLLLFPGAFSVAGLNVFRCHGYMGLFLDFLGILKHACWGKMPYPKNMGQTAQTA